METPTGTSTAWDQHPFASRPHRTLVALAFPVMLSLVAEPLTGLVDTAFVARLGAAPLAALGVGTVLLSSTLWVFNFLGVGTQTEVAQAFGAGDSARGREVSGVALALALAIGIGLALLGWPLLGAVAPPWARRARWSRRRSPTSRSGCSARPP